MTLWCFGDSYITSKNNNWTSEIATYLECDEKNFGICGSSLEFMYSMFDQATFDDNDYVIIVLTEINRRYFFPQYPDVSTPTLPDSVLSKVSRLERKAMNQYFIHLNNDSVHKANLKNFLYHVQYVTERKNLTTIVFNCFSDYEFINNTNYPNLVLVPGTLFSISAGEIENSPWFYQKFGNMDIRANHLCLTNHRILADKVINYYKTQTPIVLDGFVTDIITDNNYRDLIFQEAELSLEILKFVDLR